MTMTIDEELIISQPRRRLSVFLKMCWNYTVCTTCFNNWEIAFNEGFVGTNLPKPGTYT
jgi:hypothetical protein